MREFMLTLARALELGAKLAPQLLGSLGPTTPRYADKDNNPWGAQRPFLDRARDGAFPTFRIARKVTALWSDCEAAIEARATTIPQKMSESAADELAREGVRPRAPRAAKAGGR